MALFVSTFFISILWAVLNTMLYRSASKTYSNFLRVWAILRNMPLLAAVIADASSLPTFLSMTLPTFWTYLISFLGFSLLTSLLIVIVVVQLSLIYVSLVCFLLTITYLTSYRSIHKTSFNLIWFRAIRRNMSLFPAPITHLLFSNTLQRGSSYIPYRLLPFSFVVVLLLHI